MATSDNHPTQIQGDSDQVWTTTFTSWPCAYESQRTSATGKHNRTRTTTTPSSSSSSSKIISPCFSLIPKWRWWHVDESWNNPLNSSKLKMSGRISWENYQRTSHRNSFEDQFRVWDCIAPPSDTLSSPYHALSVISHVRPPAEIHNVSEHTSFDSVVQQLRVESTLTTTSEYETAEHGHDVPCTDTLSSLSRTLSPRFQLPLLSLLHHLRVSSLNFTLSSQLSMLFFPLLFLRNPVSLFAFLLIFTIILFVLDTENRIEGKKSQEWWFFTLNHWCWSVFLFSLSLFCSFVFFLPDGSHLLFFASLPSLLSSQFSSPPTEKEEGREEQRRRENEWKPCPLSCMGLRKRRGEGEEKGRKVLHCSSILHGLVICIPQSFPSVFPLLLLLILFLRHWFLLRVHVLHSPTAVFTSDRLLMQDASPCLEPDKEYGSIVRR